MNTNGSGSAKRRGGNVSVPAHLVLRSLVRQPLPLITPAKGGVHLAGPRTALPCHNDDILRASRLVRLLLGLCQTQADELPVGNILDHGFHKARAILLMIQVVRVFPHVAGPQRVCA